MLDVSGHAIHNFVQIDNHMQNSLGKVYLTHDIFKELNRYSEFYDSLSFSTMGFVSSGTGAIINFDTYVFTSMKGTLESIHDILLKGRINDSYALLRKYYDSVIINIYTNIYLSVNQTLEEFIVKKIDDWVRGKEKIPSFGVMSDYIIKSQKVAVITELIYKDNTFKGSALEEIRQKCNKHMHYLFYHNMLLNDNEIYSDKRLENLNNFLNDIRKIFILHFAYLFYLKDHYMISSDYMDCMDVGLEPPENSQSWVATFIQEIFNDVIKPHRPDIAKAIKEHTGMQLI